MLGDADSTGAILGQLAGRHTDFARFMLCSKGKYPAMRDLK